MTRPRSVTAAAGLAGLTAALTALLWTAMDPAATTVAAPPRPQPPEGVSPAEWERASTSPSSGPDREPFTNLELFGWLVDGGSVALALAVVVLWLVVAVAAARGSGRSQLAAAAAAVQAMTLPGVAVGSTPGVLAVTAAVIATGAASAVLLFRPESIAHFSTSSEPSAAAGRTS